MDTELRNSNIRQKDQVIQYIRKALQSGELQPNTKLPSERKLAEMFEISRSAVREALKTLETYGIIKTLPQSGSVIVGLDISAIDGLLSDVIQLDAFDFASLIEMRAILEVNSARFCAARRTEEDLIEIRLALDNYINLYHNNTPEEISAADFAYHRAIVTGSKNSVLRSMLMLITPDILHLYQAQSICANDTNDTFAEHELIYKYILEQDEENAAKTMAKHLKGVLTYATSLRERQEV
ncbi:MAG: FadR/GntR family transcriptional regulator [Rikenellaceae bacterium]